jgi:hypothetical protein
LSKRHAPGPHSTRLPSSRDAVFLPLSETSFFFFVKQRALSPSLSFSFQDYYYIYLMPTLQPAKQQKNKKQNKIANGRNPGSTWLRRNQNSLHLFALLIIRI